MRMAIYARASTGEQSPELRDYAKRRGLVVHRAYVDHTGGEVRRRRRAPAFEEPMADARRRCFDCVLVGKYDRFARSLGALVTALPEFRDLGVDLMRRAPRVALSCRSVIPGTAALGLDGPGPHPCGVADMEYDAKGHHELWRRTAHPPARPAPGLGRGQRCWPVERRLAGGTTADRHCAVTGSVSSSDSDSRHLHISSCICTLLKVLNEYAQSVHKY